MTGRVAGRAPHPVIPTESASLPVIPTKFTPHHVFPTELESLELFMPDQRQSFWRLAAYASPAYITGVLLFSTAAIIPAFYAKHAGLSLALIGTILAAGRLFDAVTDPAIGYLSDITKSRLGARKPWILAGFALAMVSMYFLYIPDETSGAVYFTLWLFMLYFAFTMISIPHVAWGTEISRRYDERSRISTYVGMSSQLGSLTFALIPLIPLFALQGYNAKSLKFIAIFYVALMPVVALMAILWGPKGKPVAVEKPSIKTMFASVRKNRPFWFYLMPAIVGGLGNGIFFATIFLYTDTYLQLGKYFPHVLVIDAVATFLAMPFWLKIMYRLGKHRTMTIGWFIGAASMMAIAFLQPGEASLIPFLILVAVRAMAVAAGYAIPMALMGDVIDYDILKTGVNRSANYFAFSAFIGKINAALGSGIGFIIIGAFGYTVQGPNSDFANKGLIFTSLILPAIAMIIGGIALWYFPLDHRRQSIIRRRIEARAQRAERDGVLLK